jgi:hypothetical protein
MSNAIRSILQQFPQLFRARRKRGFREMNRDLEIGVPGTLEARRENGDVADGGITAEIEADDPEMAVFEGEIDDFEGLREGVAAVDGEDEAGFHGRGKVEGEDAGEDREDVVIFGDTCRRDGALFEGLAY